jgi:hypothetical protein
MPGLKHKNNPFCHQYGIIYVIIAGISDAEMLKRILLLVLAVSCASAPLRAQGEMPDRKGKFYLIPEVWLSVGTRSYIDVAPLVGYHLTHRLSAGLGPHYIYMAQKATPYLPFSYHTHLYGGKVFARFSVITDAEKFLPVNLFSELFLHIEYEAISLEKAYFYAPTYPDEGRFIYQGFLVGGGLSQRVGPLNSISFMVLWDLNESSRSPYSNPVLRFAFNIYL